jgi:hypothetical protein
LLGRRDIAGLTKVLLELGEIERLSELLKDPLFAREIDASIQDAVARSALDELENWISLAKYVPELGDKARLILSFYLELLSGNFREAESHLHALRHDPEARSKRGYSMANGSLCARGNFILCARQIK